MTEWYSRRTYKYLLDDLGGFVPEHQDRIKTDGEGYHNFVRSFDLLLKKYKVKENRLVDLLSRNWSNGNLFNYYEVIPRLMEEEGLLRKGMAKKFSEELMSIAWG